MVEKGFSLAIRAISRWTSLRPWGARLASDHVIDISKSLTGRYDASARRFADDHQAFAPLRPPERQQDPKQAIYTPEARATCSAAIQYGNLMEQRDRFQQQRSPGSAFASGDRHHSACLNRQEATRGSKSQRHSHASRPLNFFMEETVQVLFDEGALAEKVHKLKAGFFAIGVADLARPDLITAVATNAEHLNFATFWAPEHVVLLERFSSRYPYSRGENILIPADTPLLNPFLALTYAAARTSKTW